MLASKVLASGITHLTDARYFAAWEVDYLAFPLGEGVSEAISWDYLNALREWVEGPEIVAELGKIEDATPWLEVLPAQNIKTVLLYGDDSEPAGEAFKAAGITVITKLEVDRHVTGDDVEADLALLPSTDIYLIDFADYMTYQDMLQGEILNPSALNRIAEGNRMLIDINIGKTDPKQIIAEHPIAGFAVRGSSEEKVGYKSFDDLDDLFEGLEVFE